MSQTFPFLSQPWLRAFHDAPVRRQCELLLNGLQSIPKNTEVGELPSLVYETWNALADPHPGDAAEILRTYAAAMPELYSGEPAEYDLFLLDTDLLEGETEQAAAIAEHIVSSDEPEAQTLETAVDRLRLWGYADMATHAATRGLDALIAAAGTPLEDLRYLQNVLREARLQEAFETRQRGDEVDYRRLMSELEDLGYENRPEETERLRLSLEHGFASPEGFAQALRMAPDEALRVLGREFAAHSLLEWGVPFVCSDMWLVEAIDFLTEYRETAQPGAKENEAPEGGKVVTVEEGTPIEDPDEFWRFDATDLEEYLTSRHLQFGSQTLHRAVALVWALPIFLEYLESRGYATSERRAEAIEAIAPTRMRLSNLLGPSRWHFGFVHRWPKPESLSDAEWQREQTAFKETFQPFTPPSPQ